MWLYDKFVKKDSKAVTKKTKINEKAIAFVIREEFMRLVDREVEQTEED